MYCTRERGVITIIVKQHNVEPWEIDRYRGVKQGVEKTIFSESLTLLPSNSKTLTFRKFKMKSQVWKHFETSDGDSSLAICKICNTRISRGSLKCSTSHNTSNMWKHILSKHREVSLAQDSRLYPLHKQVYCTGCAYKYYYSAAETKGI